MIDVKRDGFLATMDVSCWSFLRMAHLAEPLMKNGGTLFTMTYYGSQMVVENYDIMGLASAPYRSRSRPEGYPGACHLARPTGDTRGLGNSGV